jgi:hypothetical protein
MELVKFRKCFTNLTIPQKASPIFLTGKNSVARPEQYLVYENDDSKTAVCWYRDTADKITKCLSFLGSDLGG